jgi:hypothetical protein
LVTKIQAKDIPLQILIGCTGQAGRLINLSTPIRKEILKRPEFSGELRHLLRNRQTEI